jgi:hypothetical protein
VPIPLNVSAGDSAQTTEGVPVHFDGTGTGPAAEIDHYRWRFGDGTEADGPTPIHAYASRHIHRELDRVVRRRTGLRLGDAAPRQTTQVTVTDNGGATLAGATVLYAGATHSWTSPCAATSTKPANSSAGVAAAETAAGDGIGEVGRLDLDSGQDGSPVRHFPALRAGGGDLCVRVDRGSPFSSAWIRSMRAAVTVVNTGDTDRLRCRGPVFRGHEMGHGATRSPSHLSRARFAEIRLKPCAADLSRVTFGHQRLVRAHVDLPLPHRRGGGPWEVCVRSHGGFVRMGTAGFGASRGLAPP